MSPAWLCAHRRDRVDEVDAADDRGRLPGEICVGEGVRHDVLLCRVDPVGEWIPGTFRPRRRGRLVGASALEQHVAALGEPGNDRPHQVGIEELEGPATMAESPAGVLVGTSRCLHDTVEAHELTRNYPHMLSCSFAWPLGLCDSASEA